MTHEDFTAGMRKLTSSVTIISCAYKGERYGLTASAVTALSAEPPSLLACVNQSASAHNFLQKSGLFSVNILSSAQSDIASAFAAEEAEQRFDFGDWKTGPQGSPQLTGAAASFECELVDSLPGFTHNIFIGKITHIVTSSAEPLLYGDTHYGRFAPHKPTS